MAFNVSKTIMLEKQYLYVRASKGFQLVGTSTERIWTNTGYYRFLVENVAKSIGNSYVTIEYDNTDTDFIAYCSDLFLEEIQNSITTAVENLETILDDFADANHEDIDTLSAGLSVSMNALIGDNGTQNAIKDILAKGQTVSNNNNVLKVLSNLYSRLGSSGDVVNGSQLLQTLYGSLSRNCILVYDKTITSKSDALFVWAYSLAGNYPMPVNRMYIKEGVSLKFSSPNAGVRYQILVFDDFGNVEYQEIQNDEYSFVGGVGGSILNFIVS